MRALCIMHRCALVALVTAAAVVIMHAGVLVAAGADTLGTTAEKVRAAKVREAALRSIDASVEFLEERLSRPEELALEMLADPEAHQEPRDSREILRREEEDRLTQAFREQLTAFVAGRRDELPANWVDEVMERESARVKATVDHLLGARFNIEHEEARRQAVRLQRVKLDETIYPSTEEVEALAGLPEEFVAMRGGDLATHLATPEGATLLDAYVISTGSGQALFQENRALLEKRVRQAILSALTLLWRQLRLVDRTDAEGAVERSRIAARIVAEVELLATEAEQLSGTDYGVFPLARVLADERSEAFEIQAFSDFLQAQLNPAGGCSALPEQRIEREIPSSYDGVPAAAAEHQQALAETLGAEAEARLVDTYVQQLDDAELQVSTTLK